MAASGTATGELHAAVVRHDAQLVPDSLGRLSFCLLTFVYKYLHGLAPPYLAVDCVPVTSLPSRRHLRHLRSAESDCLAVTGARTTLGSRNFAVAGAKICNSLPVDLRLLAQSLRTFGHKLKHYLFVNES